MNRCAYFIEEAGLFNGLLYLLENLLPQNRKHMEYLNIMPLSIQGDGNAQTGQTGANDDNFQWHIGESSDIQKLKSII